MTKAVRVHKVGGPEVLTYESVEVPAPGPGEVAVRVRACALNRLDLWVREGWPTLRLRFPSIKRVIGHAEPTSQASA